MTPHGSRVEHHLPPHERATESQTANVSCGSVIVLDSNQVRSVGVHGNSKLTMLRAVAQMAGHRLAIPAMALTELLNDFNRSYEAKLNAYLGCDEASAELTSMRRDVLALVPRREGAKSYAVAGPDGGSVPTLEAAAQMRELRLKRLFAVLGSPLGAAEEGDARESERRRPALPSGGSGKGGRDVVIWLTALEAAKDYPGNVYFVSDDKGFKGDDGRLHPDLVVEAQKGGRSNLVYCATVERLIERLSCPVDPPVNLDATLRDVVKNVEFAALVSDRSGWDRGQTSHEITWEVWDFPAAGSPGVHRRLDGDEVMHVRHDQVEARRVGDTTLTVARVEWTVKRRYYDGVNAQGRSEIAFSVGTSILLRHVDDQPGTGECWYRWPAQPGGERDGDIG